MSEMKMPQQIGGDYRPHYRKHEADAYIAALERRARIAERVISKVFEPNDDRMKELIADAEFEIDAEIAQEGR